MNDVEKSVTYLVDWLIDQSGHPKPLDLTPILHFKYRSSQLFTLNTLVVLPNDFSTLQLSLLPCTISVYLFHSHISLAPVYCILTTIVLLFTPFCTVSHHLLSLTFVSSITLLLCPLFSTFTHQPYPVSTDIFLYPSPFMHIYHQLPVNLCSSLCFPSYLLS